MTTLGKDETVFGTEVLVEKYLLLHGMLRAAYSAQRDFGWRCAG